MISAAKALGMFAFGTFIVLVAAGGAMNGERAVWIFMAGLNGVLMASEYISRRLDK